LYSRRALSVPTGTYNEFSNIGTNMPFALEREHSNKINFPDATTSISNASRQDYICREPVSTDALHQIAHANPLNKNTHPFRV
jgi:hypothetical protein